MWDHLHLNLALYVKPKKLQDAAPRRKLTSEIEAAVDSNSKLERGNSNKFSRTRHNKDWKGLGRGEAEARAPTISSSKVDIAHLDEKVRRKVDHGSRSPSPKPESTVQRKRDRTDEKHRTKV